jgi:hypothetical protein
LPQLLQVGRLGPLGNCRYFRRERGDTIRGNKMAKVLRGGAIKFAFLGRGVEVMRAKALEYFLEVVMVLGC